MSGEREERNKGRRKKERRKRKARAERMSKRERGRGKRETEAAEKRYESKSISDFGLKLLHPSRREYTAFPGHV